MCWATVRETRWRNPHDQGQGAAREFSLQAQSFRNKLGHVCPGQTLSRMVQKVAAILIIKQYPLADAAGQIPAELLCPVLPGLARSCMCQRLRKSPPRHRSMLASIADRWPSLPRVARPQGATCVLSVHMPAAVAMGQKRAD